jgi:acyl CoA:acetate/3-ketoacid CoA transferase alpha subunit
MKVLETGEGELHGWMHPDDARQWMAEEKIRAQVDKRMPLAEAVKKFTRDGDYFAMGGFGHIRLSMAGIYEMIRQRRRNLIMAAKTGVHDVDILIASGVVDKVDCAYSFGHELRGLSPAGRRAVQTGRVSVVAEISNAGFQWRFKAAAMGLPWLPARIMLGTDTFRHSPAKTVEDPYTGQPITLLPACYPDFAFIHVHRCDMYGNCQIDGITIEDIDLARAAKRLIVTTEKIVDNSKIISHPDRTAIPHFVVNAVVESPYGSHPGNMPGMYYSDEEHIAEWLTLSRSDEGVEKYLNKYVYGVDSQDEYIELVGGKRKMEYLHRLENLEVELDAPWARR